MSSINFILQSVDGIGKTYISTKIADYFKSQNAKLVALYCDQEGMLLNYYLKSVEQKIELIDASGQLISSAFNRIIAKAAISKSNILIDCAAKDFVTISQFFAQFSTQNLLRENEIETYLHVVIVGGSQQDETLNGLLTICKIVPESVKIVVWLNQFFGQIEAEGKAFEELKLYKNNRERIHSVLRIEETNLAGDLNEIGSNLIHQLDAIFGLIAPPNLDALINQKNEELAINILQNSRKFGREFVEEKLQIERLDRYSQLLNATFEKHLNLLSASNSLLLNEASNRSEIIVTQAAEYLTRRLRQAADESFDTTSKFLALKIAEANKAAEDAKKSRDFAIYASIIALAFLACDLIWKLYSVH